MRFDELIHHSPRIYAAKVTIIFRSKQLLYKILGIQKQQNYIADAYFKKRETIFQQFFKNKKVLDVGCGRGDFLTSLREKYGCYCIGLDISKNMIFYASQNNSTSIYVVGSSDFLPFKDDAVDVVHFNHVFHHLPPNIQEKTLKESKRVAKEVVMIDDNVNWENRFKRFLANIFWKITDGGYIYRTETEWRKFLQNENILDCSVGKYLMRHCYFVIDADGSDGNTKG